MSKAECRECTEIPATAEEGPRLPWMKFWVADLLTSSFVMSLSEVDFARYVRLLFRAWDSDTPCFLPNDVKILARFAGASSLKSFKATWAIISFKFTPTLDGKFLFNQWLGPDPDFCSRRLARKNKQANRGNIPVRVRLRVLAIGHCAHCGSTRYLEVDHVVPLSRGGTDVESNLQPLCRSCNHIKSNNLEEELDAR